MEPVRFKTFSGFSKQPCTNRTITPSVERLTPHGACVLSRVRKRVRGNALPPFRSPTSDLLDLQLRAARLGPVDVEELAAWLIDALVGVRTKKVPLALQQV